MTCMFLEQCSSSQLNGHVYTKYPREKCDSDLEKHPKRRREAKVENLQYIVL